MSERMGRPVAIFGGTFDPIHHGHLAIAERTIECFAAERLLLVPAWLPPHKPGESITAWHHRFAMAVLACQDLPRVSVSAVEQMRAGPSFTVETLEHFRGKVGPRTPLLFVMGSDSLAELALWKEPARILELAHVVVAPRPGFDREEAVRSLGPQLGPVQEMTPGSCPDEPGGRILWLDWDPVEISGSEIRRRLAAGRPAGDLVPPPVAAYILKHRIFPEPRSPGPA